MDCLTVETPPAKQKPAKPLGHRAYGSIPHLPGSRRGPADIGLSEQQASILTSKARDKHDLVTVQEKLDGSCVAVAKINGAIVPLIRAGYEAQGSNWAQHHFFHAWAMERERRFAGLLMEGQRAVGEWLMEAHGTRYNLPHEPFVIFDIMEGNKRTNAESARILCSEHAFTTPRVLHIGGPISIDAILKVLEPSGHGAIDPVEGAVWRVERDGNVDFLGKYVRPDKVDGKYLENITGGAPIYNWLP